MQALLSAENSWVVPQAKAEMQLAAVFLDYEPRFIEPVGPWNQQQIERQRVTRPIDELGPAHTQPKYFAPNGGKVVNLFGLAENKAVNCIVK